MIFENNEKKDYEISLIFEGRFGGNAKVERKK